ncbi:DUF3313 domain-containing protein [Rhizobium sp. BR 314]|uniref:DUF3313 domain-containing protein n=1 Tax=Rhizobium sp. BR 314 TaxID=3040013 RepID=UPI0039BFD61A
MMNFKAAFLLIPPVAIAMAGCSSVPLKDAGTLSTYRNLGPATGNTSKSRTFVDKNELINVRTVNISPTGYGFDAGAQIKAPQDRALVSNAINRSLCIALSSKYQIVPIDQPADLTIKAVISDVVPTNKAVAGISKVASLGSSAAIGFGIPRLPIGFGGLAVEGEAIDAYGVQRAAIIWSRGANSFTTGARLSDVGDAYSLASSFGDQFAAMLKDGRPPGDFKISLPSTDQIKATLGGRPKYAACEAFGGTKGLIGVVAGGLGAPPSWTDRAGVAPTKVPNIQ